MIDPSQIFFSYLSKCYALFLSGEDNFDELEKELGSNFGASVSRSFEYVLMRPLDTKNDGLQRETTRLQKEFETLQKELQELGETESPLVVLERKKTSFLGESAKLRKSISELEQQKEKIVEKLEKQKSDMQLKEAELAEALTEKKELELIVSRQKISPAEVEKFRADCSKLRESIDTTIRQRDEEAKIAWDREITVAKKMEIVEILVREFNRMAERLFLIPKTAKNADGIDYELRLNMHAPRPEQMLSVNIKGTIKPSLMRLREALTARNHESRNEAISLREKLDQIEDLLAEKTEEVARLSSKQEKIDQHYQEQKKSMSVESKNISSELEQLEQDLLSLRSNKEGNLLQAQQTLQKIKIE